MATQGIRINGIAPVATATPLIKSHWEQLGHKFSNKTDRVHRGTMLEPEECAHTIVWLLCDGASAMNATTISVDRGATSTR
ncbi:SDR family oxidoreductase [Bombilactobacillus bombi]|uniref:SDR family oxidoreductase n=1 Tax=Bombilactobacillus bombi TaxID=1303590 RepID=UPI0015E5FF21